MEFGLLSVAGVSDVVGGYSLLVRDQCRTTYYQCIMQNNYMYILIAGKSQCDGDSVCVCVYLLCLCNILHSSLYL